MASAKRAGPTIAHAVEALGDPRAMPDLMWTASLLGTTPHQVEATVAEIANLAEMEGGIHARHLAAGRDFYAQFRAPLELYAFVRQLKPAHVIETGVSSGVSSAHLLLALQKNRAGTLHSIDFPVYQAGTVLGEKESPVSIPPGREPGWSMPDGLRDGWDLRIGPSQKLLPALVKELPSVGLFLHDSLHTPAHLTFELETIRPKLLPGSVVLADNTEWTGNSFDKFAASLGAEVLRRAGSDLVGLRVPPTRAAPSKRRSRRAT